MNASRSSVSPVCPLKWCIEDRVRTALARGWINWPKASARAWTVTDTDRAPVLTNPGSQTSVRGEAASLQLAATDADSDSLIYDAEGLPSGLTIDSFTGEISGTIDPTAASTTPYVITITADDGTLTASQSFNWTVNIANHAPLLTAPENQTSAAGEFVSLALDASDADNDALTYTASGLPAGLTINPGTGEIFGTLADAAPSGSPYSVTVKASDGAASASQSFNWTVNFVGITNPGVVIDWGDGSALSSGTITGEDGTFLISGSHSYAIARDYTVHATISDDDGNLVHATSTIEVGDVYVANDFSVSLATFTTANVGMTAGDFSATIHWGDGSTSAGIITGSAGSFLVKGNHAYLTTGTYMVDIDVTSECTGPFHASRRIVAVEPMISACTASLEFIDSLTFTNREVATFVDPDALHTSGEYRAMIDWGDGTAPSVGTIIGSHGIFQVFGTHDFQRSKEYPIKVELDRMLVGNIPIGAALLLVSAAPAQNAATFVRGRFTYDTTPGQAKPVRRALVRVTADDTVKDAYTDDTGAYSVKLDPGPYKKLSVSLIAESEPPDRVKRSIAVVDNIALLYEVKITFTDSPFEGTINASKVIDNTSSNGKAFWVFDALTTAARLHRTLEGIKPGWVRVGFPDIKALLTSFTISETIHLKSTDWDSWDSIIHEYGHAVAQGLGFFPFSNFDLGRLNAPAGHSTGQNIREFKQVGGITYGAEDLTKLAFSEGFANFYSMLAQVEEGVSTPPVKSTGTRTTDMAGDKLLYDNTVEAGLPLQNFALPRTEIFSGKSPAGDSGGEDEELTVMRTLWDLYDAVGTPSNADDMLNGTQLDRVSMRYQGLIKLLTDKQVTTLRKLWEVLKADATTGGALNVPKLLDYNAVFQLNNLAPRPLEMRVAGAASATWNPSQPIPQFVWEVPVGAGTVGELLNNFSLTFYNSTFATSVSLSPNPNTRDGTKVILTPTATEWAKVTANGTGTFYWTVSGGDFGKGTFLSGPFTSDKLQIRLDPAPTP